MFKICLLIALTVAGVCAQDTVGEAAPEPYNYAYDAGTHNAAEQRDASGKVTGYYMLADADGRQRRVDYVADEAGFRAKVQTNEMGTKSENSADVEVLAAPPSAEQYTQAQRYVSTQQVVTAPPKVTTGVQYVQQPYGYSGYSYYPGSYYGSNYGSNYGYGVAGSPSYGYYGSGNTGVYGGYSSAAPATSYYKQTVQPASYSVGNVVSRYATVPASTAGVRYQTVGVPSTVAYQSGVVPAVASGYRTSYQTVGVPASAGYQYKAVGAPVYHSSGVVPTNVGSTGSLVGSSNYIVLKKRECVNC